jgi:very-short-patch-repair endonuclease
MGKRLRKKGRADLLPHDLMKFHYDSRLEGDKGHKNRFIYDALHSIPNGIEASDIFRFMIQPTIHRTQLDDWIRSGDYYFTFPNQDCRVLVPLKHFDEVFQEGSNYFIDFSSEELEYQNQRAYSSPRNLPIPESSLEPIPFEINGSWIEAFRFKEGYEKYLTEDIGSDWFYEEVGFNEIPLFESNVTLGLIKKEGDDWTLKRLLLYRSPFLDWWIDNHPDTKEGREKATDFHTYFYFHSHELKLNLDLLLMHHRYHSQGTETKNETARLAEKNKRFIIRPDMVQKLEKTNYTYPAELLKIGPYRNGIVFDFDYCDDSFLHYDWQDVSDIGSEFMSTVFMFESEESIWFNVYGDIEAVRTLIIPKKGIVDDAGNITPKLVKQHIKNIFGQYKSTLIDSETNDFASEKEYMELLKNMDQMSQSFFGDLKHPLFRHNVEIESQSIFPRLAQGTLFQMCGLQGRWEDHTPQTLKQLEKFWNQVVSICLNLCIYIQSPISEPEIRQVSGIEKTQRGGKIRTKLPYRVLGKTGVKYVSSKTSKSTGEKRAMHLRSGHWRTQPIKHRSGKEAKYIQEKSDGSLWITHWIQSTWVNSNDTEKVSSQDIAIGVTNENKSLAEKRAVEMLQQYFPDLKHNGRYPWLRNRQGNMLELDIYINQKGLRFAVEMDGEQHYIPSAKFGGREAFRVRKANDVAKDKICREKNIPLIRIRNRDWDMELDSLLQAIRNKLPKKMLSSFDEVVLMGTVK